MVTQCLLYVYIVPQTLKNLSGRGRQARSGNKQFSRGPTQTEKKFRVRLGFI